MVQYKPLLDQALAMSTHKVCCRFDSQTCINCKTLIQSKQVEQTVVFQRKQHKCDLVAGRDLDWTQAVATLGKPTGCALLCLRLFTSF